MEAQTNLRTLYAQENLIEKIEGLDSFLQVRASLCPSLFLVEIGKATAGTLWAHAAPPFPSISRGFFILKRWLDVLG